MVGDLRNSGIDLIGDVPWGTHFCQFYRTKEDLTDILVPYFKAGLENNEFCMWVTAEPLQADEATRALAAAMPDFDEYVARGQIEIIPHTDWYLKGGAFDMHRVLNGWVDRLNAARARGFAGLRLTGNTFFLERDGWDAFAEYEGVVNSVIGQYSMVAICSYCLDKCDGAAVIDVVKNHQFALVRQQGKWELIESAIYKQARQALQQSRDELEKAAADWRSTFDAISDFVSFHDKDYCVIKANRAFAEAAGIDGQVPSSVPCYQLVHGTQEPWPDCPHRLAMERKETVSTEFYEPRLGKYIEVVCSPIFGNGGTEATGTVHVVRDITERKRAEEALRESQHDLNRAQAVAKTGSWRLDTQNNRLLWSDETYRMFGISPETSLTYEAFLAAVLPADRERVDGSWQAALRGEPYDIEHRIVVGNEVKWVREKAELDFNEQRELVAGFGTVQDITERKQSEEQLRQRTAELEAANLELEAFSYSVSHDLRAPLRSMEGFSDALLEDYTDKLDDQGKEYLKWIQESSALMSQLIDDLLTLSRATRSELQWETVDLTGLARSVMANLQRREPARQIESSIAPGLVCQGDARLLRLVLENLLDNAWKFTGKVAMPRIEVGVTEDYGQRAYYVRDNGVGFDMAYVDKLFHPFQRLHKATEFGGTGIGLATVQRIISRHGGRIWAEGKTGQGAIFYFSLS